MFSIFLHAGCGLAFNLNASLTIISKYFLARRPLANGLAMAGSPVFLCFLAPLNQYLLGTYGWRGSLLILGGLMLNCCVAGALMRPVCKTLACAPQQNVDRPNKCKTKIKGSCMKNTKKFVDLSFFRDRGFVIYLIGNVMFIFGLCSCLPMLLAKVLRSTLRPTCSPLWALLTCLFDPAPAW